MAVAEQQKKTNDLLQQRVSVCLDLLLMERLPLSEVGPEGVLCANVSAPLFFSGHEGWGVQHVQSLPLSRYWVH